MTTEQKHALYLVKKGERPTLFHADDVDSAEADGWEEPDFPRSNGQAWNAEKDLPAQDAAAQLRKPKAKSEGKTSKKK